jgi:membrane-associated HD superfamily phosphohydrolase
MRTLASVTLLLALVAFVVSGFRSHQPWWRRIAKVSFFSSLVVVGVWSAMSGSFVQRHSVPLTGPAAVGAGSLLAVFGLYAILEVLVFGPRRSRRDREETDSE